MSGRTALGYVLDDNGKLVDAFIQATMGSDPAPTPVELGIVAIVKENRELRADNAAIEEKMRLHAGDCCSLNNEAMMFKDHWDTAEEENSTLRADLKARDEEIERLRKALERIRVWSKAYPLDIFPKPDLKKAHKVLKAAGMTLDAISADTMRHVLEGIKDIIEQALKAPAASGG